jgi:hypothetical protein
MVTVKNSGSKVKLILQETPHNKWQKGIPNAWWSKLQELLEGVGLEGEFLCNPHHRVHGSPDLEGVLKYVGRVTHHDGSFSLRLQTGGNGHHLVFTLICQRQKPEAVPKILEQKFGLEKDEPEPEPIGADLSVYDKLAFVSEAVERQRQRKEIAAIVEGKKAEVAEAQAMLDACVQELQEAETLAAGLASEQQDDEILLKGVEELMKDP